MCTLLLPFLFLSLSPFLCFSSSPSRIERPSIRGKGGWRQGGRRGGGGGGEEEERSWLSAREEELACCPEESEREKERAERGNKTEQEKKREGGQREILGEKRGTEIVQEGERNERE